MRINKYQIAIAALIIANIGAFVGAAVIFGNQLNKATEQSVIHIQDVQGVDYKCYPVVKD